MKCCDTNEEKSTREEKQGKLTGLAWLGIGGTIITCLVCFTPLMVALLGVIGMAGWTGYLDKALASRIRTSRQTNRLLMSF